MTQWKSLAERFWNKVDTSGECWLWTGQVRVYGAGNLTFAANGKQHHIAAHRVSWEIHHGPVSIGKRVIQTCHNPLCVNPDHLRLSSSRLTVMQRRFAGVELPIDPPWCSEHHWRIFVAHVHDYRSYEELAEEHGYHLKSIREIVSKVAGYIDDPASCPKRPTRVSTPRDAIQERPERVRDRNWSIYVRHVHNRETLQSIGDDVELTKERVRQIVNLVEVRAAQSGPHSNG